MILSEPLCCWFCADPATKNDKCTKCKKTLCYNHMLACNECRRDFCDFEEDHPSCLKHSDRTGFYICDDPHCIQKDLTRSLHNPLFK